MLKGNRTATLERGALRTQGREMEQCITAKTWMQGEVTKMFFKKRVQVCLCLNCVLPFEKPLKNEFWKMGILRRINAFDKFHVSGLSEPFPLSFNFYRQLQHQSESLATASIAACMLNFGIARCCSRGDSRGYFTEIFISVVNFQS